MKIQHTEQNLEIRCIWQNSKLKYHNSVIFSPPCIAL